MSRKAVTAADIIIVAVICLLAALAWAVPAFSRGGKTVVVRVDNLEVERMSLSKNQEKTVSTEYGTNTVTVQNGQCFVSDADCRDGICVKRGKISRAGESIVCLPHRLIVEIE